MVKPQLGHDQVVFEWRWSLNTGGHKGRVHCITNGLSSVQYVRGGNMELHHAMVTHCPKYASIAFGYMSC